MTIVDLAKTAITSRQTLYFDYDDRPRVVEVHAVGISSKGNTILRGYQVAGQSSRPLPGWALFTVDKIKNASLSLMPISEAPRPGYVMGDKNMATIIAQVPLT